ENPYYRNNWSEFHVELYHRQAERESQAHDKPFITDRGTVDAFAFHPATMREVGTTLEQEHQRYTSVVQLGTSAILGEKFYQRDIIRNESMAEALEIEKKIKKVWSGHPGYHFVDAEIDFEKKFHTFLKLVTNLARIETQDH
ncbi:MAG: AAA family ATPase, partial [Candidatus Zixiibacteriota bacterium]